MKHPKTIQEEWPLLLTLLPADLEATAQATGALQRKRGVGSAQALLRLAFAYAYCGLSLQATATWAGKAGVARLSAVALFKRLRGAADWCGHLLAQQLAHRAALRRDQLPAGLQLSLVDATTASRPGSSGTDWRVHVKFDLGRLCVSAVTLTDAQGGESLKQYPVAPGEWVVGDRGYAHRQGIAAVAAVGAALIVRLNWQNVPLQRRDGTPFDLLAALRPLAPAESGDWAVQTAPAPDGTPAVAGRLVAVRKSPQAAEASRRQVRAAAKKKGKTPDARSLEACDFLFVFTTLSVEQLAAPAVLEVYRFRWQIELAFKRLKSLLALDELAAKDAAFCRMFLCIKLLGALLVEQLSHRWVDFSPWGYGPPAPTLALPGVSGGGRLGAPGGGCRAHADAVGSGCRSVANGLSGHAAAAALSSDGGCLLCSSASNL